MTADEARLLLLVRRCERTRAAPWQQADADWATAEAGRIEADAPAERQVVRRAALLAQRLVQADARLGSALRASVVPAWGGWLLCILAAVGGLAIDRIGPGGRINILAPPVLALLLWNGLVYLMLLARSRVRPSLTVDAASTWSAGLGAWWRSWVVGARRGSVATGFLGDWTEAAAPLLAARATTALHLAAAIVAIAMLASMYARGLVLEYRAGWDSTFLDASMVHRLVSVVLGPAAALSGIALPGPEELARLRFSVGNGENAARWIHLCAITVMAVVVLPRVGLAARAAVTARRLTRDFPLAVDAEELLRQRPDAALLGVPVLPYAHQQAAGAQPALRHHLARNLGRPVEPLLLNNLPLGTDALPALPDVDAAAPLVLLFNLAATPEAETHGAFVRAVRARWPQRRVLVLVDEAAFRVRLGADVAAARLEPRRAGWRQTLAGLGDAPVFVDLSEPAHG